MSREPLRPVDSWIPLSRRQLLQAGSLGLGWLAVQFLGQTERARAESAAAIPINLRPKQPQLPARAQVGHSADAERRAEPYGPLRAEAAPSPNSTASRTRSRSKCSSRGARRTRSSRVPSVSLRRARCGMELSEVIPHIGSVADDLCLVRSMHSEHNNHTEGLIMFMTGKIFRAAPASAHGSPMPSEPKTRTCPPTSCSAIRPVTTRRGRSPGVPAGCRPSIAEPNSARPARPSST